MFNLDVITPYIELLYKDTMDVYHYGATTNADNTTDMGRSATPDLIAIPCKLSFDYETVEKPLDALPVDGTGIKANLKIFCNNEVAIKAGDYVVATRKNSTGVTIATYKGVLGMPSVFSNHQEVLLGIEGNA